MSAVHPLLRPSIVRVIERAVSAHTGTTWIVDDFIDLDDRASHPCGLLRGNLCSVFAKLDTAPISEQFQAELRGLDLLARRAKVMTPRPVAAGVVECDAGHLLLLEAISEIPARMRTAGQWRSIGRALAMLHQVHDERFGSARGDGFFGPLRQDNRPVASNRWADFYAERRLTPLLRSAVDNGCLPPGLADGVERLIGRLPALCGPEPLPTLLHGDAQQNNFLTTAAEAILIDVAPYFGHPEIDLALLDYFEPVPEQVFDGYCDVAPIDTGFWQRRELWRLFGYLAVVAVDGRSPFGRRFIDRIAGAVTRYR